MWHRAQPPMQLCDHGAPPPRYRVFKKPISTVRGPAFAGARPYLKSCQPPVQRSPDRRLVVTRSARPHRRRSRTCSSVRHRCWRQPHVQRARSFARYCPERACLPGGDMPRAWHARPRRGRPPEFRSRSDEGARRSAAPRCGAVGGQSPPATSVRSPLPQPAHRLARPGLQRAATVAKAAWFRAGLGARGCGSCAGEPWRTQVGALRPRLRE